ncbi:5-formyltetrahydrofolate cyclo-ligase [Halobaculum sp. MBLA0147]|uniref:5-formyltetrahydrofolate cyclo-ligase n=1 Tax=Halobaculum sp. MBLA0147 TaxID=3079934 RepID=UPI003526413C
MTDEGTGATSPEDKDALRETVWDHLETSGEARFPFPPHGRIPNFAGADAAADRLAETTAWETATTVKANPDAPQLPVRRAALRAGKTVFVAVPRLREPEPFLRLDPDAIPSEEVDDATTVSGISEYGEPVAPEAVPHVDLIVSGSVLVTPAGGRIGKGEGYSDLEFAVLRAFDAVDETTTVATTVHESQVRPADATLFDAHDVPVDVVCTPERTLTPGEQERSLCRPEGIDWAAVDDERLDEIPVLARLADERGEG